MGDPKETAVEELSLSETQAGGHHEVGDSGADDQRRDPAEVDNE
jgi:hypothetical protein